MAKFNKKILFGIEGCGKSTQELSLTFESLRPHEFAFYAGVSYDSLVEKQTWLTATFGGDDTCFPICATRVNDRNAHCVWSSEAPFRVPETAKIVLVVQASITNCNFLEFELPARAYWAKLIIDEFGFGNFMVPGYDQQLLSLVRDKLSENTIGNIAKAFAEHVKRSYAWDDYVKIVEEQFEPCFEPHWLKLCHEKEVVVLTSEKLAVLALQVLGFNLTEFQVSLTKRAELAKCIVYYRPARVNTMFFDIFNAKGWEVLPFQTIITNKAEGDLRCVNHMRAKGSNGYQAQEVCSVISNIPNQQLRNLTDSINKFAKEPVMFEQVQRLFYRDVLCQAVGRTCGFRGKNAHVLISHVIWEMLKNKLADLDIPYQFAVWKVSEELALRLQEVADASDAKSNALRLTKQDRHSIDKELTRSKINVFVDEHFEAGDGCVSYAQIRNTFEQSSSIRTHDGKIPQPCVVAKLFGVKPRKRWVGKRAQHVIDGVILRNAE